MADNPLCPDCRKQMTPRFICLHCGYDTQRLQTSTNRKVVATPYNCVKCDRPTGKLIEDIPVCGDCFVQCWGRLPDMSLSPIGETTQIIEKPIEVTETFTGVAYQYPCPKCKRKFSTKTGLGIHKKSKHGGTR